MAVRLAGALDGAGSGATREAEEAEESRVGLQFTSLMNEDVRRQNPHSLILGLVSGQHTATAVGKELMELHCHLHFVYHFFGASASLLRASFRVARSKSGSGSCTSSQLKGAPPYLSQLPQVVGSKSPIRNR